MAAVLPAGTIAGTRSRKYTWPALGLVLLYVVTCVLLVPFRHPPEDFWPFDTVARVGAAYLLPLPLAGAFVCVFLIFLQGSARGPLPLLLAGWFLIAGGIAFDVLATVVHSPLLTEEMNPIARALLDSGHGLGFVYGYGLLMQGGAVLFCCLVWSAFLRHRRGPWPVALALVWLLVPLVLGEGLYRWYLGLTWFQLVPWVADDTLQFGIKGPAVALYVGWWLISGRGTSRVSEALSAQQGD